MKKKSNLTIYGEPTDFESVKLKNGGYILCKKVKNWRLKVLYKLHIDARLFEFGTKTAYREYKVNEFTIEKTARIYYPEEIKCSEELYIKYNEKYNTKKARQYRLITDYCEKVQKMKKYPF